MLLEVKVMGSAEWYEQAIPAFEEFGFKQMEDMNWSDPETDGEFMGFYYDVGNKPIPFEHMADFISEIEKIIMDGEAPFIKFRMVPAKKSKNTH